jgi:c-di-GMP-binding flagellar brake protein YcgR
LEGSNLSSFGAESEKELQDKRQWRRYEVDVRLRATVRSGGVMRSVYGRGTDLSIGGMSAFLAIDIPEREVVELDVTLPYASQPLKLKATVCNRAGYKYGLKFVDITTAQQKLIHRTCGALEFTQ